MAEAFEQSGDGVNTGLEGVDLCLQRIQRLRDALLL